MRRSPFGLLPLGVLLILSFAGCERYLSPIEVEYTSKGVCSGVELTPYSAGVAYIEILDPDRPGDRWEPLTPEGPTRIPDPASPAPPYCEPRLTRYRIGLHVFAPSSLEVELGWRCLPRRGEWRVSFTHSVNSPKALTIVEDPDSPYGFTVWVVDALDRQ